MNPTSPRSRLDDAVASVRAALVDLDKAIIELQSYPEAAEQLDPNDRELAAVLSRYRAQLEELFPLPASASIRAGGSASGEAVDERRSRASRARQPERGRVAAIGEQCSRLNLRTTYAW